MTWPGGYAPGKCSLQKTRATQKLYKMGSGTYGHENWRKYNPLDWRDAEGFKCQGFMLFSRLRPMSGRRFTNSSLICRPVAAVLMSSAQLKSMLGGEVGLV
jgi:hypothetical protein